MSPRSSLFVREFEDNVTICSIVQTPKPMTKTLRPILVSQAFKPDSQAKQTKFKGKSYSQSLRDKIPCVYFLPVLLRIYTF